MAMKPDYLEQLEKCGWFNGWPKEAADKYRRRIATGLKEVSEPWVSAVLINGDAECVDGEGDFTATLKNIARQSCGLIRPTKIRESWDNDPVRFSFDLGGQRFEARLPLEGDYLPSEFYGLLARAVNAACKPLQLVELLSGGQDFFCVLVTPKALKAAVKKKLIPARQIVKKTRPRTEQKKGKAEESEEESGPVLERESFRKYIAMHRQFAHLDVAKALGVAEDKVSESTELASLWSADPRARIEQARAIRDHLTFSFTIGLDLLFVCPLRVVLGARTVGALLDGFVRAFADALEAHDRRVMAYGAAPEAFFQQLDIPGRLRSALAAELGVAPERLLPATDLRREFGLDEQRMGDIHNVIEETLACQGLTPSLRGANTFAGLCGAAQREMLTALHATARKSGLTFPAGYRVPVGPRSDWACFTMEIAAAAAEPKVFEKLIPRPAVRTPLMLAWKRTMSGSGDYAGLGHAGGGRLFVALGKSDLEAWDLRTGDTLWKAAKVRTGALFMTAGGRPFATLVEEKPGAGEDVLHVTAFDPIGGRCLKMWKSIHFLGENAEGLVFQFRNRKSVRGGSGFMVVDRDNLETVREVAGTGVSSCALTGNTVVAPVRSEDHNCLVVYNLADGTEVACKVITTKGFDTEDPQHVHGDLVVTRFREGEHPYLACRRATDLKELWRIDDQTLDVISAETRESGGRLLVSSSRSGPDLKGPAELHCLDLQTGKTLWRKGSDPNIFLPPDGNLYWTHHPFGGLRKGFHRLTAMSLDTGEPVWSCDVEGKDYFFVDACASGHLYCRTCARTGPVEAICFREIDA